jgi:hypothetical protein
MGMTVSVFRWGLGDCTNNGVSAVAGSLCVVNVPGPFDPSPALPAVELVEGPGGRAMQSFARLRRKGRAWSGQCSGEIMRKPATTDLPRPCVS